RADRESRREQRWREAALSLGRELHGTLDFDELADRLLATMRSRTGTNVAGLLACDRDGRRLVPAAIRGDAMTRLARLSIPREGELANILCGLGRPALRGELERVPEVRAELAAFVSARFAMLVPLITRHTLLGIVVLDERPDGSLLPAGEAAVLR